MSEERDEIAARLKVARYPCRERQQPCPHCRSEVYQGCMFLAEAVLTPRVEPELEVFR
jgi:hypothetical protein